MTCGRYESAMNKSRAAVGNVSEAFSIQHDAEGYIKSQSLALCKKKQPSL